MRGKACAAFSENFIWSKSFYGKVMAAGRVDEEVLEKLDKGLARKLEFEYNIPGQN